MSAQPGPNWSRVLRSLPLFAALSPEDMAALSAIAVLEEVPAGRRIWRQGEPGNRLIVLVRGQIEATRVSAEGNTESLRRLLRGAVAGETSLMLGDPHDVTLTSLTPVRFLSIPREPFLALARKRPSLALSIRPREDICAALDAPRFRWQEAGERVTRVERRHPWVFWRSLFWPSLFAVLVPPAVRFLGLGPQYLLSAALVAVAWVTWLWLEWRNDTLVLTTQRLVRVEKKLPFYQRQEGASLDKVQDVAVERHGLAAALFGFGHVTVQTAGTTGQITFSHCPHPDAVKEAVFGAVNRYASLQRAARRQDLESQLRQQLGLGAPQDGTPTTGQPPEDELPAPESHLDEVALQMTRMISRGFPSLRTQDGDVVLWRKHWVVLLRSLAWPALAAAALAGLPLLAGMELPPKVMLAAALALVAWTWWQWENWRNDVYVLTPERIIDIHRQPLRLRTAQREGHLLNIQNVTYVVPGAMASLLNYGHVTIETAGQVGSFTFDHVFDPAAVQADIFQYIEACRAQWESRQQRTQGEALADILAAYERLRNESASRPSGKAAPA